MRLVLFGKCEAVHLGSGPMLPARPKGGGLPLRGAPPRLFVAWRASQWKDLLQAIYLHDRCAVLKTVMSELPAADLDEDCLEVVYLHDRLKIMKDFIAHKVNRSSAAGRRDDRPAAAAAAAAPSAPDVAHPCGAAAAMPDQKMVIENPTNLKEIGNAADKASACAVCLAKKAHVVCQPCFHIAVCMDCVKKLKTNSCVKCNAPATKWTITA